MPDPELATLGHRVGDHGGHGVEAHRRSGLEVVARPAGVAGLDESRPAAVHLVGQRLMARPTEERGRLLRRQRVERERHVHHMAGTEPAAESGRRPGEVVEPHRRAGADPLFGVAQAGDAEGAVRFECGEHVARRGVRTRLRIHARGRLGQAGAAQRAGESRRRDAVDGAAGHEVQARLLVGAADQQRQPGLGVALQRGQRRRRQHRAVDHRQERWLAADGPPLGAVAQVLDHEFDAGDQLGHRHRGQGLCRGRDLQGFRGRGRDALRLRRREVVLRRALGDRALEQALRRRHAHQQHHALRAGRLARQRDLARVAPEGGDVALNPLQRRHRIQQPAVGRHPWHVHEPIDAHAVVHGDHDDALARKGTAVVPALGRVHAVVRTAGEPDQHRCVARSRRGPDVQRQVVDLAGQATTGCTRGLRRHRAVCRRIAHAGPHGCRLGRLESVGCHKGVGSVRDALEGRHRAVARAAQLALLDGRGGAAAIEVLQANARSLRAAGQAQRARAERGPGAEKLTSSNEMWFDMQCSKKGLSM